MIYPDEVKKERGIIIVAQDKHCFAGETIKHMKENIRGGHCEILLAQNAMLGKIRTINN